MAKNDKVLIDGIIDDRIEQKLPSEKRDEAFEYFSFEQILKEYDLSYDEIIQGSVDGRNDGGIDGIFILINGHVLADPETFKWPKSGSILEAWIITCKHHDTFKQAPLDNLAASIVELLDFTVESTALQGDYSEQILRYRENLKLAYRKVSPRLSQFTINFCYASRGNTNEMGDSIISRANQITTIAKEAFGNSSSQFYFFGSTELIDLNRKTPNFSLEFPFIDDLSSGETYILLVNLKDYYSFIQDNGKLRRYLFDSNVRDFMGLNRVNEDIRETLSNIDSPDFWWLNNGVTILGTGASVIGKIIQIQDIQIVNGLQTSESIFRYFENGGDDPQNRSVLVKVIVSKDNKVRDAIIRATNNQTTVELSALHATDKIQRDIEDILKRNDYYYERRTNYYKNIGASSARMVTPLFLASGFVNLILKAPDQASRLRSKFMRSESSYEKVFSAETDLNVWLPIAHILKYTDAFLESIRPIGNGASENFLKSKRQLLSFITISRIFKTFNFSINDLIKLDLSKYTNDELQISWEFIKSINTDFPKKNNVTRRLFVMVCQEAHEKWTIKGIGRFTTGVPFESLSGNKDSRRYTVSKSQVSMDFALKVNELLPAQPWKPRLHREIIEKLDCTMDEYFDAVKLLIDEGMRYNQKDGVVYNEDGNVICFDEERVDGETLKLKMR
jgi:hypothetical protein